MSVVGDARLNFLVNERDEAERASLAFVLRDNASYEPTDLLSTDVYWRGKRAEAIWFARCFQRLRNHDLAKKHLSKAAKHRRTEMHYRGRV